MTTSSPRMLIGLVFAAGLCSVSASQRPSDVIRWRATAPEGSAKPGSTVAIRLTVDIDPGWHLYAFDQPNGGPRSLEMSAAKGTPFTVVSAKIDAPPPKILHDPNFNLETRYYDEQTTIVVPARVAAGEAAGTRHASLNITFQACTERICLRPYTETVNFDITIANADRGRQGARIR